MILEITIILLGLMVVIFGYTTFNLLRKSEKLEDIVTEYDNYILNLTTSLQGSEDRLKEIDDKGIFEGDDEIGWFFNEIKQIQTNLSKFKINI
jgi:HAMP domain-containing protein